MYTPSRRIVYVTRDIERALGIDPGPNFFIATNRTPYSETIKEKFPDYVALIEPKGDGIMGTGDLLSHPGVEALIRNTGSEILLFKNTARIEPIIYKMRKTLLNPRAIQAEKIENKISQIEWLGEKGSSMLPPHQIKLVKEIEWNGKGFILQWAHGHTGDGTLFIDSDDTLQAIKNKFPERICRITDFIKGPSFTVNVVITPDKILAGNVSYQITGLQPFTDNVYSTVGNDWGLALTLLTEKELIEIDSIINEIGKKLQKENWRGLFGLDFMRDEERDRIVLIEINARQPASTTFESILERKYREQGIKGYTTFEAHIAALLGDKIEEKIIQINDGAQIVQRVTKDTTDISGSSMSLLKEAGYNIIHYKNNTDRNSDILRIQSEKTIMEGHNKLNFRGKEILSICHSNIT